MGQDIGAERWKMFDWAQRAEAAATIAVSVAIMLSLLSLRYCINSVMLN